MSNVVSLHRQPAPVARFLRVTEPRRLDQLLEADKLPYLRFVVEAGYFTEQHVLIDTLRQRGQQLMLETKIDALSAGPEPVRPKHFRDKHLTESDRRVRLLSKLKLADRKLASRLGDDAKRVDRRRNVLGRLEQASGSASRSPRFPSGA